MKKRGRIIAYVIVAPNGWCIRETLDWHELGAWKKFFGFDGKRLPPVIRLHKDKGWRAVRLRNHLDANVTGAPVTTNAEHEAP